MAHQQPLEGGVLIRGDVPNIHLSYTTKAKGDT